MTVLKISLFSYLMWVAYAYGEIGDGSVRCQQSGDDAPPCRYFVHTLQVNGGGGELEGQLCSLTPRPPWPVPANNVRRGLDAGTTWAPTLLSEIIPPRPSIHRELPLPLLARACPSRPPQSLVLFRILLEAICTPRHLAASQLAIHPLPGCNLHLFPVASGRCRGARLT